MEQREGAAKDTILWWGRSDVDYSRNRIVRKILKDLGWNLIDFYPRVSAFGDIEVLFSELPKVDLVWVPCFRQRDYFAAKRFANRRGLPLLFDPLISSYDKEVFEKGKLEEGSPKAEKLRQRESQMMCSANLLLADTLEHARFFSEVLGADPGKVMVVPVGAEEEIFQPQPSREAKDPIEVLFYGSFIPLQGVETIVEAARLAPEINWTLLGRGPLLERCLSGAEGLNNVRFEAWVEYPSLPARIGAADILLGVFGITPKAARVIPNKVYQSLACARPVVTLESGVYGDTVRGMNRGGMAYVPSGSPEALAATVKEWAAQPELLGDRGRNAREIYQAAFSVATVESAISHALNKIFNVAMPDQG